jgi:hypothetical protein
MSFPKTQLDINPRTKYQKWVITAFNLSEQWTRWREWLESYHLMKDYFWGVELAPDKQTPHAHIGIWLKEQVRFPTLRKVFKEAKLTCWLAPMLGTWEEAIDYATKDEGSSSLDMVCQQLGCPRSRLPLTQKSDAAKERGAAASRLKKKLSKAVEMIIEGQRREALAELEPYEAVRATNLLTHALSYMPNRVYAPLVLWIYGSTGAGKTALAQYLQNRLDVAAHWQGLEANAKFWNGYHGQEMIVLDEVRSSTLPMVTFLRLANHAPYQVEVKNGFVPVNSPLIVLTSPLPPWLVWPELRDLNGDENDLSQVMRRINLVVKMLPPNNSSSGVVCPCLPWKARLVRQEDQDIPEETLRLYLGKEEELPTGWAWQHSSWKNANAILMEAQSHSMESLRILPVVSLTLSFQAVRSLATTTQVECSPKKKSSSTDSLSQSSNNSSCTTQNLNNSELCESQSIETSEICVDTENSNEQNVSWSSRARLPSRIDRESFVKHLKQESLVDIQYVVEFRNITSEICAQMEEHYFCNLFE